MYVGLVFLLGPVALGLATANVAETRNPGIVISENHRLVSIAATPRPINIDLSGLNLHSINRNAFVNCASATTLDLSNNSLQEVPVNIFSPMVNLEHLSLANNKLRGPGTRNAFHGLTRLKSLNISGNPLKKNLVQQNFAGLPKSCDIYISGSKKFQTLTPLAFRKNKGKPEVAQVDDQTTQSPRNQGRQCHLRPNRMIEDILGVYMPIIDERARVKVCLQNNIVSSVVEYNATEDLSTGLCKRVELELHEPRFRIGELRIKSFEKGWYQIKKLPFNAVYLSHNKIEQITDVLLNDLPEIVKYVSLEANQIERVNKSVIVNEHLLALDLSKNNLRVIEVDAFAGTRLTHLNLEINFLKDIAFSQSLPTSLVVLNLGGNEIDEIPARSFSHLKKLIDLQLCYNNMTELLSESLTGLDSLQSLQLCFAELQKVERGVFHDLTNLHNLNLYGNLISSLDRGVFEGLECLMSLDLSGNKLETFSPDNLYGLTDNLVRLDLNTNDIHSLEANSFVGIPTSELSLQNNKISQIAMNAFNLPNLIDLALQGNQITKIEKGTFRNLSNLSGSVHLRLARNPLKRLENGALAGLPHDSYVHLEQTGIEVIQAGVFDDA